MRHELHELTMFLVLGLPFGVAAAGLGGYALARRALAPVRSHGRSGRTITAARLNDRLPVDHPQDELGRLAVVFNQTLERLEQSFEQMRRFTGRRLARAADAADRNPDGRRGRRCVSHAARTRTARIIGSMLEEADRLTSLIERLLMLSRAESGPAHWWSSASSSVSWPTRSPHISASWPRRTGSRFVSGDRPSAACDVDRLVLRQALVNLVDNAIKYSPADERNRDPDVRIRGWGRPRSEGQGRGNRS